VYDLIGNVYEWQDNCSGSSCFLYGAAYKLINVDDRQDRCTDFISKLRNVNSTNIGFRCCAS
jgi:formylglycine-generating enzyme required for sulfatase activity